MNGLKLLKKLILFTFFCGIFDDKHKIGNGSFNCIFNLPVIAKGGVGKY